VGFSVKLGPRNKKAGLHYRVLVDQGRRVLVQFTVGLERGACHSRTPAQVPVLQSVGNSDDTGPWPLFSRAVSSHLSGAAMPGRTINGLGAESSRKRARRDDAEQSEEVEVVEVQQARSNLRTEPVSGQSNSTPSLCAIILTDKECAAQTGTPLRRRRC